ncbi:MAG: SAM-dependent methyltransferase, partial [Thermaurantiacus sp.]
RTAGLVERARSEAVALVSDAGTPLVSDPGFDLVRAARAAGVPVTAIPGPSAAIAALSIAGLPSDRFFFAGFLPVRGGARADAILELKAVPGTLILYETGPRLADALAALEAGLGNREAALARELTKRHEEVWTGRLSDFRARVEREGAPRGELVLLLGPAAEGAGSAGEEAVADALREAMARMPAGKAAASVAAAFGLPRAEVYALALGLSGKVR